MAHQLQTLREARTARGWTQVELADRSGVEQSIISRLERGQTIDPANSTVKALEEALRVRRGSLVFGLQSEAVAS